MRPQTILRNYFHAKDENHCLACQRRTGCVFGTQARFQQKAAKITCRSSEYVRAGDSGRTLTFHLCPHCWAMVHYRIECLDEYFTISVGVFADPTFPATRLSVYEERKHAWVGLPHDIEHLA